VRGIRQTILYHAGIGDKGVRSNVEEVSESPCVDACSAANDAIYAAVGNISSSCV
jgi:hypothetical protein